MRVFLAGATGVIGIRLLPLLVERGDTVAGLTRSPGKAARLERLGAEPVVCDVYAADALTEHVVGFRPELVIHQLTDLPDAADELPAAGAANARIRTEGTANLLAAARAAGATGFAAQSIAWDPAGEGLIAKQALEREVLAFGGVVIRYGRLYGPGTYHPSAPPDHPRIHVDAAAAATLGALARAGQIVELAEDR